MESRVYAVLFQFNQGVETTLDALNAPEKMDLETPEYVEKIRGRVQQTEANADNRLTYRISKRETDEQLQNERERRKQELRDEDPIAIYMRIATAEDICRKRGLPPCAVIFPWTKLEDRRALERIKALTAQLAAESLTTDPRQPSPATKASAQP